jgi:hypothetical protein
MMRAPLDVLAPRTSDLHGLRRQQLGEHDHPHLLHDDNRHFLVASIASSWGSKSWQT